MRILLRLGLAAAIAAASMTPATAQNYGYGNAPPGSYQNSCSNIVMRGTMLRATCTADNGQTMRTSVNLQSCRGTDIANVNGSLTCTNNMSYSHRYNNNGRYNGGYRYGNSYGNNYALPQGSYLQSCTNARMSGNLLSASCTAANGQSQYSRLNMNRCAGSTDIRNENGRLRC